MNLYDAAADSGGTDRNVCFTSARPWVLARGVTQALLPVNLYDAAADSGGIDRNVFSLARGLGFSRVV